MALLLSEPVDIVSVLQGAVAGTAMSEDVVEVFEVAWIDILGLDLVDHRQKVV